MTSVSWVYHTPTCPHRSPDGQPAPQSSLFTGLHHGDKPEALTVLCTRCRRRPSDKYSILHFPPFVRLVNGICSVPWGPRAGGATPLWPPAPWEAPTILSALARPALPSLKPKKLILNIKPCVSALIQPLCPPGSSGGLCSICMQRFWGIKAQA